MAHVFAAPQTAPLPKPSGATLSLVLGIVSVGGLFVLVVPVLLAPLAWYHGAAARRRAEREPDRWSRSPEATAGVVLGMIGSAMMAVLLGLLLLVCAGLLLASSHDGGYVT